MDPFTIILTIALYFILLFSISFITGRKANNQDFFSGNRKSSWYVVAFAMIGSAISGVTFVSVPGMVAAQSFSYLQMVLGFVVGQLIIAFVLIPLFYKMNLTSIYEYLENRFGIASYKTGAWFFFISKMLGAAVRLFLVCIVLQILVFDAFSMPFIVNVLFTVGLVWLYTFRGGVKSLIWTDSLKTFCLILSVGLSIYYIAVSLDLNIPSLIAQVQAHDYSKMFFFDDINDKRYFFKQFLAGVFTVIATTGLDQDMMQKTLSCKNYQDAQKNMVTSGILQFFVILLFLTLGVMLYLFAATNNVALPEKSDQVFPFLATNQYFPAIVGVLFIIGLISAAYAAAGSALTALTTSFTVDILESPKHKTETQLVTIRKRVHVGMAVMMVISAAYAAAGSALTALTTSFTVDILESPKHKTETQLVTIRKRVHVGMAVMMGIIILVINLLNNTSVINAVYVIASYTYGPILGLFAFGVFTKIAVKDRFIPLIAIVAPCICYIIDINSKAWFGGYEFSYELLIMNAFITFIGCLLARK